MHRKVSYIEDRIHGFVDEDTLKEGSGILQKAAMPRPAIISLYMSLPPNGPALRGGNFTYLTACDGETKEARVVEGQLFVCKGCCCGATEKGNPEVPLPRFKHEWKQRNMRYRVHLTVSACLGPCVGVNVVLFVYGGQTVWFHSINADSDVVQIYDYIDHVLERSRFEMPTGPLAAKVFQRYESDAICSPDNRNEPACVD
jgi:cobaltochelatase CobN